MTRSRFLIAAALLAALLSTAACGKKGAPEPIAGGTYPTTYPTH